MEEKVKSLSPYFRAPMSGIPWSSKRSYLTNAHPQNPETWQWYCRDGQKSGIHDDSTMTYLLKTKMFIKMFIMMKMVMMIMMKMVMAIMMIMVMINALNGANATSTIRRK